MLMGAVATALTMNRAILFYLVLSSLFLSTPGFSQAGPSGTQAAQPSSAYVAGNAGTPAGAPPQSGPVSYASVTQLNGMLSQLEAVAKNTQSDLQRLRIERWKTDGSYKKQSLSNVDSLQRNLQGALPEIIAQLRAAPEDVPASFKLFRNLDALYDVLGSVTESTGAFGSKDDLQALSNDLNVIEGVRKQLGERIDTLATSKEAEINRLRSDLKAAQAQIPATPPKKIVVDENEPKKPAAKKKPVVKPLTPTAKPTTPAAAKPSAGQAVPQTPAKPQ